jgi:hypothetical protein
MDQWDDEAEQAKEAFNALSLRQSSLVFSVFATENGRKLLEEWKRILMLSATASRGLDRVSIGMNEGHKAFVRTIIQSVEIHEAQ